ncbi:hypothetical protein B0O80DRAFT_506211 [Mortierella sp. GBAus27b]|nr:hypothetical protein B0O80DRAFT_506211 [Mortierella sp. GBAus27b]
MDQMQHQLTELRSRIKEQEMRLHPLPSIPCINTRPNIEEYKRRRGKRLSMDERRAVLHCHKVCKHEQEAGQFVATANPILRTATYLGVSPKTIKSIIHNTDSEDRRGKYPRFVTTEAMAGDIKQLVNEMNIKGKPVTVGRIRRRLSDMWEGSFIPKREAIRKTLHKLKIHYRPVGRAKTYIETTDIKAKRRHYLQERYSGKFKDAVFVWLDESYCYHHHVRNMVSVLHAYAFIPIYLCCFMHLC